MKKPSYWLIDAGNTRLKAAFFQGNDLAGEIAVDSREALEGQLSGWPTPHAGLISNVGGWDFGEWPERFGGHWLSLTPDTPLPIRINYKTPETLGNDRRALAVAGATLYPGRPVLVIDLGTCITYDLVDAEGTYLGGAISPGLQMRLRAMHHFTSALPLVSLPPAAAEKQAKELVPGPSTEASLRQGALEGWRGEIGHFREAYRAQYPGMVTVVTGGDVDRLAHLPKSSIFARPKFLLSGLKSILDYNIL
jgi:type III pantothenate kinase